MSGSSCAGILVVDDDDDVRAAIISCFEDEGYPISGARNGAEALEQLRGGGELPCLILLDMMMPVMDGPTFRAEQLRDPLLREIPLVVITANANLRQLEAELQTSGALQKPVSLRQLCDLAETHCGAPPGPAWSPVRTASS